LADSGNIQQVVNQSCLQPYVTRNDVELFADMIRHRWILIQNRGSKKDRRQRCTQLVTEHRKKAIFCSVCRFSLCSSGLFVKQLCLCFGLFFEFKIGFLQLELTMSQFVGQRLRLLEQIFGQ
jgi:hypothetical protein